MFENINKLKQEIIDKLNQATNLDDLKEIKLTYLNKKGPFSKLMGKMRELSNEEKPKYGKAVNDAKLAIETLIDEKESNFKEIELINQIENEKIDVTIPGDNIKLGSIHPLNQVIMDLEDFFIAQDRKSTRLNSSHVRISYAVFCLKKKRNSPRPRTCSS